MDKKKQAIELTVSAIESREKDIKVLKEQLKLLNEASVCLNAKGLMQVFINDECTQDKGLCDIKFKSCYYAEEVDVNNFAIAIEKLYGLDYRPLIHIAEV